MHQKFNYMFGWNTFFRFILSACLLIPCDHLNFTLLRPWRWFWKECLPTLRREESMKAKWSRHSETSFSISMALEGPFLTSHNCFRFFATTLIHWLCELWSGFCRKSVVVLPLSVYGPRLKSQKITTSAILVHAEPLLITPLCTFTSVKEHRYVPQESKFQKPPQRGVNLFLETFGIFLLFKMVALRSI